MKTSFETETINTNLDESELKSYTIEANEVMFKMLSSDIYNDKVGALIRELSTNACDAMIEAGKIDIDNPKDGMYDVHLPTYLEPYFSIRDYGTGLDEEGIERVFTYGKSSRRHSNYYSGVLGIGAKCPYAYSDEGFSVTSYYNGKYYIYYCSKNNGLPVYCLLESGETDEPNGVEVKIGVRKNNIDTFKTKAEKIYYWFRFKPNLNVELSYNKKIIMEDESYVIIHGDYYNSTGGILMGDILYDVNFKDGLTFNESRLINNVIIKANIGDVDIHPSREYCEPTEKTIRFIKDRSKDIIENIKTTKVQELISSYKTEKYLREVYFKHSKLEEEIYSLYLDISKMNIKETLPRLYCYIKRLIKFQDHPIIQNIFSYRYSGKDTHTDYTHRTLIVKTKGIKMSDIYDKHKCFLLINLKLSEFKDCKIKNRYDYDQIKEKALKTIKSLFRCSEDDIVFTSDIAGTDSKPRGARDKTFTLDFQGAPGEIEITKDTIPTEDILYLRSKGVRNNNLCYDSEGKEYNFNFCGDIGMTIFDLLKTIEKSKGPGKGVTKFVYAYKSEIADKYLKHEKFINVLDYIKENAQHITIENLEIPERGKVYLKFLDYSFYEYNMHKIFTSKLKKLILKHKDVLEKLKEPSTIDKYTRILIKMLGLESRIVLKPVDFPQEILDYDKQYSGTIVSDVLSNGRYAYCDENVYFKEFWVDNYKRPEDTDDKKEDIDHEISNSQE